MAGKLESRVGKPVYHNNPTATVVGELSYLTPLDLFLRNAFPLCSAVPFSSLSLCWCTNWCVKCALIFSKGGDELAAEVEDVCDHAAPEQVKMD